MLLAGQLSELWRRNGRRPHPGHRRHYLDADPGAGLSAIGLGGGRRGGRRVETQSVCRLGGASAAAQFVMAALAETMTPLIILAAAMLWLAGVYFFYHYRIWLR